MKAFLLAAGRGTRISKSIPAIPKCTLDVGGEPLILRTVDMLQANGIEPIIVVGYKQEVIRDILKDRDVKFVYNPFYDVTNSIGSLWLAKEHFDENEDTLIANADVFWSQSILDMVLADQRDNIMLADVRRADDGDYFFYVDEEGHLKRFGKELAREDRNTEYVGIGSLKASFVPPFLERLDKMVSDQAHGMWWENVMYDLINEHDINVLDVDGHFWAEIDFIEDYDRILEYVKEKSATE